MTDRHEQARAEARKYVRPQMLPVQTVSEHREEAFLDGWEAADANPKPTTITREAAMKVWLSGEDFGDFADALKALGIEVTDGDE